MAVDVPKTVNWRQVKRFVIFVVAAFGVIAMLGGLYQAILIPISVSLFITYLLAPLVDVMETKRINRITAVSALLALVVALLTIASVQIFPILYRQVMGLVLLAPKVADTIFQTWLPLIKKTVLELKIMNEIAVEKAWQDFNVMTQFTDQVKQGMSEILATISGFLGGVINVFLVPVFTFFFLKDHNMLIKKMRGLVPRDLLVPTEICVAKVNLTLRSVIKGQVMVAAILSVLYVGGLSLTGIHSSFAIGVVAGICRLVPYLDVIVGGFLCVVVILSDFHGWPQVLGVVFVFLLVQTLDGMIITPRVIGERVGLHPGVVIASVLSFGYLGGFWGVLLAIPVMATAKALWELGLPFYLASRAFDPDARGAGTEDGGQ